MAQRDNILQELNELQSSLSTVAVVNPYSVPDGYFEVLTDQVLNRIKVEAASNSHQELAILSPVLQQLSRKMPYDIPAGYFEELPERMLKAAMSENELSASEELETLSPLLSGLKKEMASVQGGPYSVPAGYFKNVTTRKEQPKIISITGRRWFRYAAAAIVVGVVVTAGFLALQYNMPSEKEILTSFKSDVNKMNDAEKEQLIDFLDAGLSGTETAQVTINKDEVKELLKDVPEQELKDFTQQNEDLEGLLMLGE